MKITKLGHCCLLIEEAGRTILTDPGSFSDSQNTVTGIDVVVITHEHADHLHIESLKVVMSNNPDAAVVCNSSVGLKLEQEGIAYQVLEGSNSTSIKDIAFEACDGKHEEIFEEIGQVQNTGYLIAQKLYYPGDSFTAPGKPVEILALPVAGPWCKLPDAIRFMLKVAPRKTFPVHDAMLKSLGMIPVVIGKVCAEKGIEFVPMTASDTKDL